MRDHLYALRQLYRRLLPVKYRTHISGFLLDTAVRAIVAPWMLLKGNKIRTKDYTMFLKPGDRTGIAKFFNFNIYGFLEHEAYEVALFLSGIKTNPGCIVMDVGAHFGTYTLAACARTTEQSATTIIAIEPSDDILPLLERSIQASGFVKRVTLVKAALMDVHNAECSLIAPQKGNTLDIFVKKTESMGDDSTFSDPQQISCPVRSVTLDQLLAELGIQPDDRNFIIKMDIQGNEVLAFRGMAQTLQRCRGFQLFFEFDPRLINRAGYNPVDFAQYLLELKMDVIAEIDEASRSLHIIRSLDDFQDLIDDCLNPEHEKVDANIFAAKNMPL